VQIINRWENDHFHGAILVVPEGIGGLSADSAADPIGNQKNGAIFRLTIIGIGTECSV
jgi:hypothetical protein